jgi:hypothetical protein
LAQRFHLLPVWRGEHLCLRPTLGAILACIVGILAIVFATMIVSGAMIRNDNIVDAIKEENL